MAGGSELAARGLIGLIALCGVAAGPLALSAGAREAGAPVLAVAPPWRDAAVIVATAGGSAIGPFHAPLAALGAADDGDAAGYADRLRAAGAWWVLDARALARLCGAAK